MTLSLHTACEFMWHEADLLDRRAYDEWLNLWTEDGLYIVPLEKDTEDYAEVLNLAYDDAQMRKMRVERLQGRFSISAHAASTTVRTVSRFVVVEQLDKEITVRAAQHLADYRRDNLSISAANILVTLKETSNGLRLARKVVTLVNSEDAVAGIGYLL